MYRAPLTVHLVWHPAFKRGDEYGRAVFAHLFEDPDDRTSHGLRIPVFHWRSTGEDNPHVKPPCDLPLETADRAVVVPLFDDNFLGALGWDTFLQRTERALRPGDRLVPVRLTARRRSDRLQAVDVAALPEGRRLPRVLNELTYRLYGLLGSTRDVPAFISYATTDGADIAKRVSAYLSAAKRVGAFFAPRDIERGEPWREQLRDEASSGMLVAIRTDAYGSREWCQIEVLAAKRAGMPVVVLDALERQEARGFPYLGNAPVIRWRPDDEERVLEQLLGTMLREALRFRHFRLRVDGLSQLHGIVGTHVQPAPPELLTSLAAPDKSLLVYPDPPLGPDELAVLRELKPRVKPVTPLTLLAS